MYSIDVNWILVQEEKGGKCEVQIPNIEEKILGGGSHIKAMRYLVLVIGSKFNLMHVRL
jgi:hypothetical protein